MVIKIIQIQNKHIQKTVLILSFLNPVFYENKYTDKLIKNEAKRNKERMNQRKKDRRLKTSHSSSVRVQPYPITHTHAHTAYPTTVNDRSQLSFSPVTKG